MIISGKAFVVEGDDLTADMIYPSRYLTVTDRDEQARHIFENIDPDLPRRIAKHQILVTGWNLGPGSAREQTATGLLGAGIRLVIGKSFSRMFFRNALNSGLAIVESSELADAITTGSFVSVDLAAGVAEIAGKRFHFTPLPENLLAVVQAGGLWGALKSRSVRKEANDRPLDEKVVRQPQTLIEKIFSRASKRVVRAGQFVELWPDWTFALDDGIAASVQYLQSHQILSVENPRRIALFFDHFSPANTAHHATLQNTGRQFSAQHAIHSIHDVGEGISHQVAVDKGIALPGQIAVSMDSHNMTLGGAGILGLSVGNGEMAYIWAAGATWFRVPEVIRVCLDGVLPPRTSAKDIILHLLHTHGLRWASYKAIEFEGSGIATLSIAERMTLCNMATELGAKTAIVAPDERVAKHFESLNILISLEGLKADVGAKYVDECVIDLPSIEPMLACPHSVKNVEPVAKARGVKITQAYIGTCTNGRYEDLAEAAAVLKGRHIANNVRMVVTPASRLVMTRALKDGVIGSLVEAGCSIATPGCGACAGVHQGVLGDDDVCISSGSRNYLGRMGSRRAAIYLGSPATVAASALRGEISDPRTV